jgi:hypothetical protein
MPNEVEQAERVLAELQRKRDAAVAAHGHELEERGKLAFAAFTGDGQARKRLDKLNAEIALHDSELRSLDSAIAEATARVQQAQAAEAQAADRQKAEEARKLIDGLAPCFSYLDRHLTEAARTLIAIDRGYAELRKLGFPVHADERQTRLNIGVIVKSWAHKLPRHFHDELRDGFEFLAPGARRTATQYWQMVELSLRQRLGGEERADTEAA